MLLMNMVNDDNNDIGQYNLVKDGQNGNCYDC